MVFDHPHINLAGGISTMYDKMKHSHVSFDNVPSLHLMSNYLPHFASPLYLHDHADDIHTLHQYGCPATSHTF